MASKTALVDRRKAIGSRIESESADPPRPLQDPLIPAGARSKTPPPTSRNAGGAGGDCYKPTKIFPNFLGTCPTDRVVKGEGESKVPTLLF